MHMEYAQNLLRFVLVYHVYSRIKKIITCNHHHVLGSSLEILIVISIIL